MSVEIHEAGHIVVGVLQGSRMEAAAILPHRGLAGVVWAPIPGGRLGDPDAIRRQAEMLAAGEAAELLFAPEMIAAHRDTLDGDRARIYESAAVLTRHWGGRPALWLDIIYSRAARTLTANQEAVLAIAAELEKVRSIGPAHPLIVSLRAKAARNLHHAGA